MVVNGRVVRVLESASEVKRVARESGASLRDFGSRLLIPGTVCAHAHLELSILADQLESGTEMLPWIRDVIRRRADATRTERERAAVAGAHSLLSSGTTLVGDIDSCGGAALPPSTTGIRRLSFREVLDGGDPKRRAETLASIDLPLEESAGRLEGISPHAPHTVSAELLEHVARLSERRKLPVQIHWSETPEETEWLKSGTGPFSKLLAQSPMTSGLDLLDRAGLLRRSLSLVHGNCPDDGEPSRLAEHGVALVHCPGSHLFFERAPFPLELYRKAGVTLALGTDSLASNLALDMRREMRLLRESEPGLAPEEVWQMATLGGAAALGRSGEFGELSPGAFADFALVELEESQRDSALDRLTMSSPPVEEVWVGGSPVSGESATEIPPGA